MGQRFKSIVKNEIIIVLEKNTVENCFITLNLEKFI